MVSPIPESWMPSVPMQRIILHWTAGSHKASSVDKKAYHILIEGDGKLVKGDASIADNSGNLKPGYAAHTLNCNTGSIGVSLCCMAGAVENPFNAGKYPMTEAQFEKMISAIRQLSQKYNIPIKRETVLSHAEVQPTLGIAQRQKWDITRLAFDPFKKGALIIGDYIRSRAANYSHDEPVQTYPAGVCGIVRTNGSNLATRNAPDGDQIGSLPNGTRVEILGQIGKWLEVRSPGGFTGWVSSDWIELQKQPPVEENSTPDPIRAKLNQIRKLLDELEAEI